MTQHVSPGAVVKPKKVRDPRLDFFRGLALFVILVSHTRGDVLSDWIPARFGLSDAATMFVFVSGYACGLAFGGVFKRMGFWLGTARVCLRIWQLYIAQLVVIMIVAAVSVTLDRVLGPDASHVLALDYLFANPRDALFRVVTLTYVPHYLDILPVYIAVLAMIPVAMLIARLHPLLVPITSLLLWGVTNYFSLNLPSEPGDPAGWFFDPFAWQILFFSGYSLSMRWVRLPEAHPILFWGGVLYLIFGVTVTVPAIFNSLPGWMDLQLWIVAHGNKTMMDPLQYLHFIASAYVVVSLINPRIHWLHTLAARPFVRCGQQSLSVFLTGIVLADLGGVAFDEMGTGIVQQVLINLVLFVTTFGVVLFVRWVKSAPWAKLPAPDPRVDGAMHYAKTHPLHLVREG